jgi:hypothetical protein
MLFRPRLTPRDRGFRVAGGGYDNHNAMLEPGMLQAIPGDGYDDYVGISSWEMGDSWPPQRWEP